MTSQGASKTSAGDIDNASVFSLTDGEQVVYLFKNGHLLVSGDVGAAKQIANLWTGNSQAKSFADNLAYQKTVGDLTKQEPSEISWFVDVIGYSAALERSAEGRSDDAPAVPFAKRHGF